MYHLIEVSILLNISIFGILHIKCVKVGGSLLHRYIVSLKFQKSRKQSVLWIPINIIYPNKSIQCLFIKQFLGDN